MARTQRRRRSGISRFMDQVKVGWLQPVALTALVGLTGTSSTLLQIPPLPQASAQQQQQYQKVQPAGLATPGSTVASPLDEPLRILAEAQQAYANIQTYTAVLISQERIKGKLLEENVIQMTYRKNPFSVYMKWLGPKDKAKQEVAFVQGKNNNKMKVLSTGMAAAFGFISIDVHDPKVMEHSNHTIVEAGFGNLIDRCAKCWNEERTMGKTQVQLAEFEYNKRRCIRIETVHTEFQKIFYCYRNVIYFDKETRLPVRMECYDWPRQGGAPEGELLECFSYINLVFNPYVPDALFSK